jgi:hypothetical protein
MRDAALASSFADAPDLENNACRRTAGGFWCSARHETGRWRGQAAPRADSCDSTKPPVSLGRVVAC